MDVSGWVTEYIETNINRLYFTVKKCRWKYLLYAMQRVGSIAKAKSLILKLGMFYEPY